MYSSPKHTFILVDREAQAYHILRDKSERDYNFGAPLLHSIPFLREKKGKVGTIRGNRVEVGVTRDLHKIKERTLSERKKENEQ